MTRIASAADVPPGTVVRGGKYAVGNNGEYFAVSRRCRHLGADLSEGSIDADGCLVCPWHQSANRSCGSPHWRLQRLTRINRLRL